MKKLFLVKLRTIVDLATTKPYKEDQFLAIQIHQGEIITFHNAGLLDYHEYRLLYELSTMVRDEIRIALRKDDTA